jgi:hypothetical protein
MNVTQAMEKADTVAHIQIDSIVYKRFANSIKRSQSIKYFERHDQSNVGYYDIIHAINGAPGEVNFYLKRVI